MRDPVITKKPQEAVARLDPIIRSYARAVGSSSEDEAALDLLVDLFHWFRAHGIEPRGAVRSARVHYEAEQAGRL